MAVGLYVTNRCNLNCRYCFNWENGPSPGGTDLALDKICQILDAVRETGQRYLTITGGEPFLHPDIFAIIDHTHDLGFLINILTNGLLLDEAQAQRLRNYCRLRIRVSLEGATREGHEYFRGPDTFDRAVHALEILQRHDIPVGIGFTVYPENLREIEGIFRLAREKRCGFIRFTPMVRIRKGKLARAPGDLHGKSLERIVALQLKYRDYLEFPGADTPGLSLPLEALLGKTCLAGCGFFAINPEGVILPCPLIRSDPAVFRKPFTGLADFAEMRRHMETFWKELAGRHPGACGTCGFRENCGGGCPAEKLSFDRDLHAEQPVCYEKILRELDRKFGAQIDFLKKSWISRIIANPEDQNGLCWRQAPFWWVLFPTHRGRPRLGPDAKLASLEHLVKS